MSVLKPFLCKFPSAHRHDIIDLLTTSSHQDFIPPNTPNAVQ